MNAPTRPATVRFDLPFARQRKQKPLDHGSDRFCVARIAGAATVCAVIVTMFLGLLPGAQAQRLISYVNGEYVDGVSPFEGFPRNLVGVGDVDQDGVPDVMFSLQNPLMGGSEWHVHVVSGSNGHTIHDFSAIFSDLGDALDAAGDVNGDGVPDLLIADWKSVKAPGPGSVQVMSGADGRELYYCGGDFVDDGFGHDVAGLGDIDGDGRPDFAAGSLHCDSIFTSYARVFSGADGRVLCTLYPSDQELGFGYSLAGAGDCDGDGVPDLALNAPQANFVRVISGASIAQGTPQTLWQVQGPALADDFGQVLDRAGDINGDGHDDLLVTCPHANQLTTQQGAAWVLSGVDGSPLLTLAGFNAGPDGFGVSGAGLGDVDGDGTPDVAIGDSPALPDGTSCVIVMSGFDGSILSVIRDDGAEGLSSNVARIGDFDGDRLADLALGAPSGDQIPGSALGRIYVFGFNGSWTWLDHSLYSSVGTSVLIGKGVVATGQPFDVELSNAPANAPGLLVVGLSEVMAHLKGGTLVPAPDVLGLFATDALGRTTWAGDWPPGLAPGLHIALQAWLPSAGSPQGWSASSALRLRT